MLLFNGNVQGQWHVTCPLGPWPRVVKKKKKTIAVSPSYSRTKHNDPNTFIKIKKKISYVHVRHFNKFFCRPPSRHPISPIFSGVNQSP